MLPEHHDRTVACMDMDLQMDPRVTQHHHRDLLIHTWIDMAVHHQLETEIDTPTPLKASMVLRLRTVPVVTMRKELKLSWKDQVPRLWIPLLFPCIDSFVA